MTIDTLRADHLGSYGAASAMTPGLDALAKRGVQFATALSHVPLTGPSHASMLTGRTPPGHGFRNNGGYVLAPTLRTAAEDFKQAGYRTAAFVSAFPLDRRFGFDRGFDVYEDHLPRGNDRRRTPYVERHADATTDAALRWLAAPGNDGKSGPWFMWVHYYDPHAPYEPPPDLAERFRSAPYDGEIAFVDRELSRVLTALEQGGDLGRTVVLVTADHGESLGEHGEGAHGLFVYDATIRVPWIMAGPGIGEGRVSPTLARLIDVLPTLHDYAGLPPRTGMEGRSLRPAAEGRRMDDQPSYAESLYSELELGWAPLYSWRVGGFKLIEAPRPELYDLTNDPKELTNLAETNAPRVAQLRRGLEAGVRQQTAPAGAVASSDPQAIERLRSLGYLSGSSGTRAGAGALRDPKDGVRFLPRLNRAMSAARVEPEVAIRELTAVLSEDPTLFMARRTRAVAYASAGRHDLAIADMRILEKAGELTPEDAVVLGDNLRFAGQFDDATAVLERASRDSPTFPQPLVSLAEVQIAQHRYPEAGATLEGVLKLAPDFIEALRRLGDLAFLRDDMGAAGSRYTRILELDGTDVPAMIKLGVVRMRTSQAAEGLRLFQSAISRDPKNGEALLYLAGALAAGGRPAEALAYFDRAVAADPRSTMALNGLGLARLALGDKTRAGAAFRASLRIDPSQPEIANTLRELRGGG
ncbi:MAG: sulfatase-like hydrolase/transferase [Vicinamibacteria bacterium]|nr:sulfatase-like hydrolase/transferase [Vicinamibacteria bacterium]